MADINLLGLYDEMQRMFGVQGAGLQRFEDDFVSSVNNVVRRINTELEPATAVVEVASKEDDVGNLDDKWTHVLRDGVAMYLVEMGRRVAKGMEARVRDIDDRFQEGLNLYWYNYLRTLQTADTDDETSDIVGLGHLG